MPRVTSSRPAVNRAPANRTPKAPAVDRRQLQARYDEKMAMAKKSGWADLGSAVGLLAELKTLSKSLGKPPLSKTFEKELLRGAYSVEMDRGLDEARARPDPSLAWYGMDRAVRAKNAVKMGDAEFKRRVESFGVAGAYEYYQGHTLEKQYAEKLEMAKEPGWADLGSANGLLMEIKRLGKELGLPPLSKSFERDVLRNAYTVDLDRGLKHAQWNKNASPDFGKQGFDRAVRAKNAVKMSDADFKRRLDDLGLSKAYASYLALP